MLLVCFGVLVLAFKIQAYLFLGHSCSPCLLACCRSVVLLLLLLLGPCHAELAKQTRVLLFWLFSQLDTGWDGCLQCVFCEGWAGLVPRKTAVNDCEGLLRSAFQRYFRQTSKSMFLFHTLPRCIISEAYKANNTMMSPYWIPYIQLKTIIICLM